MAVACFFAGFCTRLRITPRRRGIPKLFKLVIVEGLADCSAVHKAVDALVSSVHTIHKHIRTFARAYRDECVYGRLGSTKACFVQSEGGLHGNSEGLTQDVMCVSHCSFAGICMRRVIHQVA